MVPIEVEELIKENEEENEDEDVQVGTVENESDIVSEPMDQEDDQIKEAPKPNTRSASLPVIIPDSIKAMQAEEEKKQNEKDKSLLTTIFKKKDDSKKYTIEHILDCQSTEGFFHDNEETKKILMSFLSKGD